MLVKAIMSKSPKTVLGIDANTRALAFCLYENGKPTKWGKVHIEGDSIYEKVHDAGVKSRAIATLGKVDYVVIESAIIGRSADGSIKLAMIVGAMLATVLTKKTNVITVAPVSWQSFIGNKLLTKAEKQKIKDDNPGRSGSWYKVRERELRKSRTIDWVKSEHGITVHDDDVSDAIGIGYWGVKNI
jgi:Holliday junction resolvasome RuvABC endonuclease subunit